MGVDAEYGQLVVIEVIQLPALTDNYIYLVHDKRSAATAVVDPGVADTVLAAAAARNWTITDIWNTHWHPDHTGGNLAIKNATGATITGPAAEAAKIAGIDRTVTEGDDVRLGDSRFIVLDVGGHTLGHNAYYDAADATLFCGDTLFALGCGRLFEGTPAQMHASLSKLMALPDATRVYCAHEYTAANARFALTVEPDNAALQARAAEITRLRAENLPTVPSTIGDERATNPFVRVSGLGEFTARRAAKDAFRG